jgi:hypothetical protein
LRPLSAPVLLLQRQVEHLLEPEERD